MRRLAAIFSSKRSDKSETASNVSNNERVSHSTPPKAPAKSRSGLFKSLSKATAVQPEQKQKKQHPMSPAFTAPDHAASSSSSSSGGPSTPNDDQDSFGLHHASKKNWLPLPFLHDKILPPTPAEDHSRPYMPRVFDKNKDDDASSSSHSDEFGLVQLPPSAKLVNTSPSLSPVAYCRAIAANALEPSFSPPPLLVVANAPLFPRSCNSPRRIPRHEDSLLYRLHQTRLLRRLNVVHADRSLAALSNRKTLPAKSVSLVMDDNAVARGHHVVPASPGLRRWAERPCFEDRVFVYFPADSQHGSVRREIVYAAAAVEALGFSELLELLAGLGEEEASAKDAIYMSSPTSNTPPLSMSPSTASLNSLPPSPSVFAVTDVPSPAYGQKASPNGVQKPTPSPLRIASTEDMDPRSPPTVKFPGSPVLSASSAELRSSSYAASPVSRPAVSVPKPGVRFADDDKDKDESIPLEYVMRIKQARDQKARFLAAERARRQSSQLRDSGPRPPLETPQQMRADLHRVAEERRRLEEEKRQQEIERRKQEEDRRKLDRERVAWEQERKALEEERKQRFYAEEVAESRRRREGSRQGPMSKTSEGSVAWNGDREKERERRGSEARAAYTRPKYDDLAGTSRRQSSEPASSLPVHSSNNSSRFNMPSGSSPGSSRPPSIATGSVRDSSRPPSMYSTPPSSASAIDVRSRHDSKAARRASFMSDGNPLVTQQMMMQQAALSSGFPWGSPLPAMPMNMVPVPVPVPMMQMQMPMMQYTDMPLLPPAAPFMMHQYGQRGQGQRSQSSSPPRAYSPSSDRQGPSGRASPQNTHRRTGSDELSKRSIGTSGRSSSYTAPYHQKQSASSSSLRSAQIRPTSGMSHSQPQSFVQRPPPMSSRSQPVYPTHSRPPSDRRPAMIR